MAMTQTVTASEATTDVPKPVTVRDERTKHSYFKWDSLFNFEKPFQIFATIPSTAKDQRRTNFEFEDGPEETIHDIRGRETSFTLDKNGFTARKNQTSLSNLEDEELVKTVYLPEIESLVKREVDSADRLYIFDWRVSDPCRDFRGWMGKG